MNRGSNMLPVPMLCGTVATNATNAVYVDTKPTGNEFDHCHLIVTVPKATASGTSTITSLVINHGDTTSTISTALATGGTDFTIVTSNDTNNFACQYFSIPLKGRKRYIGVTSQAAANYPILGVHAVLSKGHVTPSLYNTVAIVNV